MSELFWDKALDTVETCEMQKRLAMALATGLSEMFSRMINFGIQGLLQSSRYKHDYLFELFIAPCPMLS